MAVRYNVSVKAAGNPSKRPSVVYFYMDNATTEEDAIAKATAIAGLMNGTMVGISKQIFHLAAADVPSFAGLPATANGGSVAIRYTFKNDVGDLDQILLPLKKKSLDDQEVEAVLETGLMNRQGRALGEIVGGGRWSQVIE